MCVLSYQPLRHTGKWLSLNLGTHEVQTCAINTYSRPGTVNISCNFTENSKAIGYLPILSSKTNFSQEMFVIASGRDATSSNLNISVPGLSQDNYTVVVYDLGGNGLPPLLEGHTNYPAEEENVIITDLGEAERLCKVYLCGNFFIDCDHKLYTSVVQLMKFLL